VRAGPRSQQTPLTLAVVEVLNRRLGGSPHRSVHGLAKAVPTISRSQLYLLLRGQAVIDLAELVAICDALEVRPRQVVGEAEDLAGGKRLALAAYEEPHPIESEQDVAEEP
jgi:DNA-binding Xre family transcriptional regulator